MENISVNGVDITDLVVSFESYDELAKETIIGNAVSTQVKLKIKNKDNKLEGLLDYPFLIGNNSYVVYQKPEKWTKILSITLYDYMILSNINYDSNLNYENGVTVSAQLDEIKEILGVEIDKTTLSSEVLNKAVGWYDNDEIIRTYLGWIAECDGKNAFIENDEIVFRPLISNIHMVDYCGDYELNELMEISRVSLEMDIGDPICIGEDVGKTLFLNPLNSYLTQQDVERIYGLYNGLSFYSFKSFKCRDDGQFKITDLVKYHDINVMPLSIKRTVNGGQAKDSLELAGELTLKEVENVQVEKNTDSRFKRIKTIVDQNDAMLKIVAEQSGENADAIGQLIVSTDEISTEVKKKVGEDEIISKINQTAEAIKILAKYIQLEGIITANGNIKILEDGSIEVNNGKFKGKVEGSSFFTTKVTEITYTQDDLVILKNLLMNKEIPPTAEQLARYDLDLNGMLNAKDYVRISNLLEGVYGSTNGKATFEDNISINLDNSGRIITERYLNGTRVEYMEFNAGSILKSGTGGIVVNGEEVVTAVNGTIARFG
jgi:hypothetical protein